MKKDLAIFEGHEIRRVFDEKTETWYFSVVDVVQVLTQQPDYKAAQNYWKVLKHRLNKEGSQLVTNCNQLKLEAADGKSYLTDVANAETLLRLVQSVPSPKAEPIKLWLARVGYERMQEMSDPARALGVHRRERTQRAQRRWDGTNRVFPLPEVFIASTPFSLFAFSAFFRGSTVFWGLKRARLELEAQTGKRVVTGENYLPPGSARKIREADDG